MNKVPFIVAEISANHIQSYDRAERLVYAAKTAGADAVKFQTYLADDMAADVMIEKGPWAGQSYRELYRKAYMPWGWHKPLFELAQRLGMVAFSAPFSVQAVCFLRSLDCPMYKIASPEIMHYELIGKTARTGKPLIISTGMASLQEIYWASEVADTNGCKDLTFMHCISSYPAKAEDFNLNTMSRLMSHNFKVGLSDHSLDNTAVIAAVALGATMIEKHLCLRRADGGPDAKFSLEPHEFASMVRASRQTAAAMGDVLFGCRPAEENSYQYRRSIWVTAPVKKGEVFSAANTAVLRPNYGIEPNHFGMILGKPAKVDIPANTPFEWRFVR